MPAVNIAKNEVGQEMRMDDAGTAFRTISPPLA